MSKLSHHLRPSNLGAWGRFLLVGTARRVSKADPQTRYFSPGHRTSTLSRQLRMTAHGMSLSFLKTSSLRATAHFFDTCVSQSQSAYTRFNDLFVRCFITFSGEDEICSSFSFLFVAFSCADEVLLLFLFFESGTVGSLWTFSIQRGPARGAT